jgi:hypothetical protein
VLTYRELGSRAGCSHRKLWPTVVERLARAWGRDPHHFSRLLDDLYTGLPRGRVTRPGGRSLLLHGDDAPVPDWEDRVIPAFRLDRRELRVLFAEHERMLPDDRLRVEDALGIAIGRHAARGSKGRAAQETRIPPGPREMIEADDRPPTPNRRRVACRSRRSASGRRRMLPWGNIPDSWRFFFEGSDTPVSDLSCPLRRGDDG